MCVAASERGFDIHRHRKRVLAPISFMLYQCSPLCYKPYCSLKYTVNTHTACICKCTHLCEDVYTHTQAASLLQFLCSPTWCITLTVYTVITSVFIVILTVSLTICPMKLKLSSLYTSLLFIRFVYFCVATLNTCTTPCCWSHEN